MSTETWDWPGARWWRCDFHLHTPASEDYKDRGITPEAWLETARDKGLDAVAVTDHNTGGWIDKLKQAAPNVEGAPVIFPGVELTVQANIHLLVLFDPKCDGQTVTAYLGACGIPADQHGKQETSSNLSLLDAMEQATRHGGLAIAPHAEYEINGFYAILGPSEQLKKILRSEHLFGVETTPDPSAELLDCLGMRTQGYERATGPLPRLEFSDAHKLRHIGIRSTWIKMTRPDLEGLRLALGDGPLSVLPGSEVEEDPNRHSHQAIESLEIRDTRFIGRQEPFDLKLNPWLNTIIGGRGSGKSSTIEFLRIALRRDRREDFPKDISNTINRIKNIPRKRDDPGLLMDSTELDLIYRKDGARYKIQWDPSGERTSILEERNSAWEKAEGEITHRFPARIYSQKQIFSLAEDNGALLRIIDESPEVDYAQWLETWRSKESRFLELRAKRRSLWEKLSGESRLQGEMADVTNKVDLFEGTDHAETLRSYQKRQAQKRVLESWRDEQLQPALALRRLVNETFPADLERTNFAEQDPIDKQMLSWADTVEDHFVELREKFTALAEEAEHAVAALHERAEYRAWLEARASTVERFESLRLRFDSQGLQGPEDYSRLVQRSHTLRDELARLAMLRERDLPELEEQARICLAELDDLRRELTRRRQAFLTDTLDGNQHVHIEVIPFGDRVNSELPLREALRREDRFDDDIGRLLEELYGPEIPDPDTLFDMRLAALRRIKSNLLDMRRDAQSGGKKFSDHLGRLTPEDINRLETWFPPDSLRISHFENGKRRPIEQASAGQRSAALLAFLLSHGDEPLILDQPEDDLDNQLIYDLIVNQLRDIKRKRQVLIVTHNPNLVVNGDAEYVIPLEMRGGQTRTLGAGGLQETKVREEICRIMEGGREAFEKRYRRILQGGPNVR